MERNETWIVNHEKQYILSEGPYQYKETALMIGMERMVRPADKPVSDPFCRRHVESMG